MVKLFAGNASLFSTVHNPFLPAEIINNDLIKISEKAYQWEISYYTSTGSYFLTKIKEKSPSKEVF